MEEYEFTPEEIEKYGIQNDGLVSEKRGKGCSSCGGTGYKGRTGIYEIFAITPAISRLILQKVSSDQLLLEAQKGGMKTMRENGIVKVKGGVTTISEVERVTG